MADSKNLRPCTEQDGASAPFPRKRCKDDPEMLAPRSSSFESMEEELDQPLRKIKRRLDDDVFEDEEDEDDYTQGYDDDDADGEDDCYYDFDEEDEEIEEKVFAEPLVLLSSPSIGSSSPSQQESSRGHNRNSLALNSFDWLPTPPTLQRFKFLGERQLKSNVTAEQWTPYNIFRLLMTDDFVDQIVNETNVFGEELKASATSRNSRIANWKHVTRNEFLKFLGITYHTGTMKMARMEDYWCLKSRRRGLLHIPCFGENMSRDRYVTIMQAINFARNPVPGQLIPTDKLYRIRLVIDHFNTTMNEIFSPGRELSIDESMVLWRGRLAFRQYMPAKRNKCGMKLYVLAEPSGLALKFLLYSGAADANISGPDHSSKVVRALLRDRIGQGHSVFAHNFYNSVVLTRELLNEQTYMTGTLKPTRKYNPVDVVNQRLQTGEVIQRYTADGICVMKWTDKREVLMISSEYNGDLTKTRSKKTRQVLTKPTMVFRYNESMGGVDRMDQMLSYYPCVRKSRQWYKKLAFHIFQMMLVNAWIIYCTCARDTRTRRTNFRDFRLDVIERLIYQDGHSVSTNSSTFYSRPKTSVGPLLIDHHLQKTDKSEAQSMQGRHKRLKCRYCKATTIYFCTGCRMDLNGNIGLCPECLHLYNHD